MKYKNIYAAIHNLGDSFLSLVNYVDGGYVIDDIENIHYKGREITIDWIGVKFDPESEITDRIQKTLNYYADSLEAYFSSMNVEFGRLKSLKFRWPIGARKFMEAIDDRDKYYKIYVREIK